MRVLGRLSDPSDPIGGRWMDFRFDASYRWRAFCHAVRRTMSGVVRAYKGAWETSGPLGMALWVIPLTLIGLYLVAFVLAYLVALLV
jgi:hypothetical protein